MAGTLAIDLGSTSTVVAFQEPGQPPRLLAIEPFSLGEPPVVPSVIWLADAEAGLPLIGRQVLEAGLLHRGGAALHRDFKRAIGGQRPGAGGATAAEQGHPAEAGTGPGAQGQPASTLSPEQAGSLLLQRIWRQLPAGLEPDRLVLTAPIDGYRDYRRWLATASEALAVAEVALVDEPTAAAIGAGLMVAEIQQSSDVTVRLHDWNRVGPDGKARLFCDGAGLCSPGRWPPGARKVGNSFAQAMMS